MTTDTNMYKIFSESHTEMVMRMIEFGKYIFNNTLICSKFRKKIDINGESYLLEISRGEDDSSFKFLTFHQPGERTRMWIRSSMLRCVAKTDDATKPCVNILVDSSDGFYDLGLFDDGSGFHVTDMSNEGSGRLSVPASTTEEQYFQRSLIEDLRYDFDTVNRLAAEGKSEMRTKTVTISRDVHIQDSRNMNEMMKQIMAGTISYRGLSDDPR